MKAIIGIANALDLKLVADGVGREFQSAVLQQSGCRIAQRLWQVYGEGCSDTNALAGTALKASRLTDKRIVVGRLKIAGGLGGEGEPPRGVGHLNAN